MKTQNILLAFLLIKSTLQSAGGEIDPIEQLLFFIIYAILIGLGLTGIKYYTSIPYTPMLLIIGLLIGLFNENLGLLGSSMEYMTGLSSHTLLFVFIPPLIFESAFNADFFIFTKSFWQILILALPGVAMLAILIAVILKFILGYDEDLGWGESLTIGAIIAATDPVAVVALLKELGTSIKFNVLLEGESLLNDGTATVFFWVFMDMVEKGFFDVGSFFHLFFRLSFGGPALGILIGLVFYQIMKNLLNAPNAFVIMSILSCYLTFFISESDHVKIKVSGILALVVLGLYLGNKLKGRLIGSLEETMHVIWHFLAYILETVLFLITGGYLGNFFQSDKVGLYLDKNDIWKIFIFQILLFLSRGLLLVILSPLINLVGTTKLGWKDLLIMTYGGLRGAIGLSLALFVATSTIKTDEVFEKFKVLCTLYVSITISFTVLFNGLTIKYVIRGIKFVEQGILFEKMKIMVKERLVMKSINKLEDIKKIKTLKEANWGKVEKIMKFNENIRLLTKNVFLLQDRELADNNHKLDSLIDSLENLIKKKKMERENMFYNKDEEKHKLERNRKNTEKSIDLQSQSKFDLYASQEEVKKLDEIKIKKEEESRDEDDDKGKSNIMKKNMKKITILRKLEDPILIKSKLSLRGSNLSNNDNRVGNRRGGLDLQSKVYKKNNLALQNSRISIVDIKSLKNHYAIMCEIRLRIYKMIVNGVLEQYEQQHCLYSTFKLTKKYSQILMEDLTKPIGMYKELQTTSSKSFWIGVFFKLMKLPLIGKFFRQKLYNELFRLYDFYSTILVVLEEIQNHSENNIVFQVLKSKKTILKEIDREIVSFQEGMDQSFNNFSMGAVQTRKAIQILVNFQRSLVKDFYIKGELTQGEFNEISYEIDQIAKKSNKIELTSEQTETNLNTERRLKFLFTHLVNLDDDEMDELEDIIVEKKLKEDDILFNIDDKPEKVYLVASGLVLMKIKSNIGIKRHGQGEIVGLENIYSHEHCVTGAKMESDGTVYEVPIDFFKKLASKHFDIEFECKKETSFFYTKDVDKNILLQKTSFFHQLRTFKSLFLNTVFKTSEPHKVLKGTQTFIKKNPLFVFNGKIVCKFQESNEEIIVGEMDAVTIGAKKITAVSDCFYFELNIDDYLKKKK